MELNFNKMGPPSRPSPRIAEEGIRAAGLTFGECPVTVTHYLVFYSPTEGGPYYYHGLTSDTTYVHTGVIAYAPAMFYTVTPMTGAIPGLLRDLEAGAMTREEVLEKIENRKFQIPVQK